MTETPGRVLAIDTAMDHCAVSLLDPDTGTMIRRSEAMTHGHAGALVPLIEDIVKQSGKGYESIGLIAVTTGPGSFTGIRVGLSCARGLALALNVPVRGFGTLETFARRYLESQTPSALTGTSILVLIETRRTNLFAQSFDLEGHPLGPAQDRSIEDIAFTNSAILLGDGAARLCQARPEFSGLTCPEGYRTIDTDFLARWAQSEEKSDANPRPASPLYIRPADVYGKPCPVEALSG